MSTCGRRTLRNQGLGKLGKLPSLTGIHLKTIHRGPAACWAQRWAESPTVFALSGQSRGRRTISK